MVKEPLPRFDQVICPVRGCKGDLLNVTPKLAEALGVMHVQCSNCKRKWATKIPKLVSCYRKR